MRQDSKVLALCQDRQSVYLGHAFPGQHCTLCAHCQTCAGPLYSAHHTRLYNCPLCCRSDRWIRIEPDLELNVDVAY